MHPYKVVYLESTIINKSIDWNRKGNTDGLSTSMELEALLIEEDKNGFELFSITPIMGNAIKSPYTSYTTIGLMVTFKEKEK